MDLPIKVIIHRAEEGGFWATVPAMPGCVTEADTKEDLVRNLREALEGWLGASQGHALEHDEHEPGEVVTL